MASPRSPEGKAARKFKESLDVLTFDPAAFAYLFVDDDPIIQERTMMIVKAIILAWAEQSARTGMMESYHIDALRFRDTIDSFGMEQPNG